MLVRVRLYGKRRIEPVERVHLYRCSCYRSSSSVMCAQCCACCCSLVRCRCSGRCRSSRAHAGRCRPRKWTRVSCAPAGEQNVGGTHELYVEFNVRAGEAGPDAGDQLAAGAPHDPRLRVARLPAARQVQPAHQVRTPNVHPHAHTRTAHQCEHHAIRIHRTYAHVRCSVYSASAVQSKRLPHRMVVGGVFAMAAFVTAGFVQLAVNVRALYVPTYCTSTCTPHLCSILFCQTLLVAYSTGGYRCDQNPRANSEPSQ